MSESESKQLIGAAGVGNVAEVTRLLTAGADVHAVECLLGAGADVHAEIGAALRWAAAEIEELKQEAAPAVCDVLNVYTVGLALPDQPATHEEPSADWGLRL